MATNMTKSLDGNYVLTYSMLQLGIEAILRLADPEAARHNSERPGDAVVQKARKNKGIPKVADLGSHQKHALSPQ